MEDINPQPFDTYQELINALKKRIGIITNIPDAIPASKEEIDMYLSYIYPVTEDNPNPNRPVLGDIEFEGHPLIKVDQETYDEMQKELKDKYE